MWVCARACVCMCVRDADSSGICEADEGPCEMFQQYPNHLPIMCDVDAPTVVIQQTLRLPSFAAAQVACDVAAPTLMLQEALHVPPPQIDTNLPNPFIEPCITVETPVDDFPAQISSPQSKPFTSSRRRSSFLVPLDSDIKMGGIAKRRSSCAFALLPTLSPEQSLDSSSLHQAQSAHDTTADSAPAASPCPVVACLASPSPCKVTSSASKRKALTAQSPKPVIGATTPKRHSLNMKSPARLSFQPSTPAILEIPQKVEADSPAIQVDCSSTPLTVPVVCEASGDMHAAAANCVDMHAAAANCENADPNLSKKTPEKKKRRLYNPARIPDALLEE